MTTLDDTTDAMVWAEEFCRIFNGHQITTARDASGMVSEYHDQHFVDEGTMVGWFANAIEVGRRVGMQQTCTHLRGYAVLEDDKRICNTCGKTFTIDVIKMKGLMQELPDE